MKRIVIAAAMVLGLSACNSSLLSLWRVAGKSAGPASCKAGSTQLPADPDTLELSNTFSALGTWEIWEGEDAEGNPVYFLGGPTLQGPQGSGNYQVVQGTFEDDVYTFDSVITATDKDALDNPQRTAVHKVQHTIKLNVLGDSFEGTWTRTTTNTCTGAQCDPQFNQSNPDCTQTTDLRGSQIEAENRYSVN